MTLPTLTDRLFQDGNAESFDPFAVFEEWFAEARLKEINDPHAMAVSTVDAEGAPDVRVVLLNARDERGFVFSPISAVPRVASCLPIPRRPSSCIGSRCAGRCGCEAASK